MFDLNLVQNLFLLPNRREYTVAGSGRIIKAAKRQ
jgi:hypothetical protein